MDSSEEAVVIAPHVAAEANPRRRSDAYARFARSALAALIVATVAVLAWHRYGMDNVLRIDADSPYQMQSVDDRGSGGKTRSVLRRADGKLVLECDIAAAHQWPFCEMAVTLGEAPEGVDFSRYDTVRISIAYEGPEPQPQVRFFLRNFNSAYSKPGDSMSLKPQEIVYDPTRHTRLEARLSQFTVASWWSSGRNIPVEHIGAEFQNIVALDLSTGAGVLPGPHRITVDRIEFVGKAIPAADLRLIVIAVWLVIVIGYLALDAVVTRRRLRSVRHRQSSLRRINEALRVQTRHFEVMAQCDPLTGLLNRKGLGDELTRLSQGEDAALFPLSLVFIDIDHFKSINDRHGHIVGDEVIKDIGRVVKENIQRHDLLARWGGEEFLLVCPMTSATDAAVIAERLRQVVAARHWPGDLQVTSSFGITELDAGEALDAGIRRADEAMYCAKRGGRDRVEIRRAVREGEALPA